MTVQELNEHPLNVAAMQRLRREQTAENTKRLHLLQWGLSNLPENDPRAGALAAFDLSAGAQEVALDRLIERSHASEGEELKTILFSMSQHGSVRAGLEILGMLPRLPVETRIAAARFLMSCPADGSLRDKARELYDAEQAPDVKRNLRNFLSRFN